MRITIGFNKLKNKSIMEEKNKCEAGCRVFTGGEIKHDKNCVYYPESLSKIMDDLKTEVLRLNIVIKRLRK